MLVEEIGTITGIGNGIVLVGGSCTGKGLLAGILAGFKGDEVGIGLFGALSGGNGLSILNGGDIKVNYLGKSVTGFDIGKIIVFGKEIKGEGVGLVDGNKRIGGNVVAKRIIGKLTLFGGINFTKNGKRIGVGGGGGIGKGAVDRGLGSLILGIIIIISDGYFGIDVTFGNKINLTID